MVQQKLGSKAEHTRKTILDAAAKILSIKGYAGTRLSDIAQEAGVQTPGIYYYFPSRDALVTAVMVAGVRQMRVNLQNILAVLDADVDPMDRILIAVEAHLRHELVISDYTTASIRNSGQVPARISEKRFEEEAKYGELWRTLITDASDQGLLREPMDVRVMQMLVLGALNWTAEWWDETRGDLDVLVAETRAFVRHAIGNGSDP